MRQWRTRFLALALCGAMSLSPALAAGSGYAGFSDVAETDWFSQGVRTCYEYGVMNGTGNGNFSPYTVMTLAQAAAIAARLGASFAGETIPAPAPGALWYAPELAYLSQKAPELEANVAAAPERSATRAEFFALLSAVTPAGQLPAINAITSLPDTEDAGVLALYNAGILTGVDAYGTFAGEKTLQRSEVAVTVARLLEPGQRKQFVPLEVPAQPDPSQYGGEVMTVNGVGVLELLVVNCMNDLVYYNDYNIYRQTGQRLDWSADYGVGDLKTFFKSAAIAQAVRITAEVSHEKELGCLAEEMPEKLVPAPERSVLEQYARDNDLLCAKHILVPDAQSAQAVLDGLAASPTLGQFNALLSIFNTDPGMDANPDGYLFTAGEMVEPFETGVRSLAFGAYSTQPVQSDYGYHIIWRLDPADHPELLERYREETYSAIVDGWVETAEIVITDRAALDAIDPQACYEAYLASFVTDGAG